MGHIVNPISHRLNYSYFWDSNWAVTRASMSGSFSFLNTENVLLLNYLKVILGKLNRRLFRRESFFINIKLFRRNNSITLIMQNRITRLTRLYSILKKSFKALLASPSTYKKRRKLYPKSIKQQFISPKEAILFWFEQKRSSTKINRSLSFFVADSRKLQRYSSKINVFEHGVYYWSFLTLLLRMRRSVARLKYNKFSFLKQFCGDIVRYLFTFRWLNGLDLLLKNFLKRFYSCVPEFTILLLPISINSLTAQFVAKYISMRLLQRFPLRPLIRIILKQMKKAINFAYIHGFKIACNGRFARRGRATHVWKVLGKLQKSDTSNNTEYAAMFPVLTNSICAVKVWLNRTQGSEKLFLN